MNFPLSDLPFEITGFLRYGTARWWPKEGKGAFPCLALPGLAWSGLHPYLGWLAEWLAAAYKLLP